MIWTVTLNPSLDYVVKVNGFKEGIVNRTSDELILAGGKGINVSLMLHELGCETKALGFLAGFTGEEIGKRIRQTGCDEDFVRLEQGFSRINVKLKSGMETEINGNGPDITAENLEYLLIKIEKNIKNGDMLVLSGSVPKTLGSSVYRKIAERVSGKKIRIVADASGNVLKEILSCRPFLVKPNHHELAEMFGVCIETREDAIIYAKKLREMGAENVLVSMAGNGAVLITEDHIYEADAPQGCVINSVGAGDSMVAGFLAGYLEDENFEKAFYLGIAAGSASAFSTELAKKEEIQRLFCEMY